MSLVQNRLGGLRRLRVIVIPVITSYRQKLGPLTPYIVDCSQCGLSAAGVFRSDTCLHCGTVFDVRSRFIRNRLFYEQSRMKTIAMRNSLNHQTQKLTKKSICKRRRLGRKSYLMRTNLVKEESSPGYSRYSLPESSKSVDSGFDAAAADDSEPDMLGAYRDTENRPNDDKSQGELVNVEFDELAPYSHPFRVVGRNVRMGSEKLNENGSTLEIVFGFGVEINISLENGPSKNIFLHPDHVIRMCVYYSEDFNLFAFCISNSTRDAIIERLNLQLTESEYKNVILLTTDDISTDSKKLLENTACKLNYFSNIGVLIFLDNFWSGIYGSKNDGLLTRQNQDDGDGIKNEGLAHKLKDVGQQGLTGGQTKQRQSKLTEAKNEPEVDYSPNFELIKFSKTSEINVNGAHECEIISIESDDDEAPNEKVDESIVFKYNDIEIRDMDIGLLESKKCLNDPLIDFWARYSFEEAIHEQHKMQMILFSQYFYTALRCHNKLVEKPKYFLPSVKKDIALQIEGHFSILKRWTNNMDIFSKNFILVPVNIQYHWLFVAICYANTVIEGESNANEVDENMKPCILIFDSWRLSKIKYYEIVERLRYFLAIEIYHKRKIQVEFTSKNLPYFLVDVIKQKPDDNSCGLHVLQNMENFCRDPFVNFRDSKAMSLWCNEKVYKKREEMYTKLKMLVGSKNPNAIKRFPVITNFSDD